MTAAPWSGSLCSSAPPEQSAELLRTATAELLTRAREFAHVRHQVRLLDGGAAREPATLRIHPALMDASPARQGWQLAEEAAARIGRAERHWLQEDLADLVEDVFGVDVAVVPVTGWFDGLAWSQPEARIAVLGSSGWPGRQRFTLAHQLCHLISGEAGRLHVDASIDSAPSERAHTEARANSFAEAFLMPAEVLQQAIPAVWTVTAFAELTTRLQLPARAVAGRLHRLGHLTAADRQAFEVLRGPEVAALAGAAHAYARRCRRAGRPRMPSRLVDDARRHGLPTPSGP